MFTWNDKNTKNVQLLDEYGKSLALDIADQLSQHIAVNDTISVQAMIQRVAQRTTVETIIVYDINHAILAQFERNDVLDISTVEHYTSQIIVQDNIVGSVSVYIDSEIIGKGSILGLITIQIALACIFAINIMSKSTYKAPSNPATSEPSAQEPKAPSYTNGCIIFIKIANWDTLFQQLNAESRAANLKQLEKTILKVSELYNSHLIANTDDGFVVLIGDDRQEDILNAFYSSQLILNLNRNNSQSMLDLKVVIQKTQNETPFYSTLEATQKLLTTKNSLHDLFLHKEISQTIDLSFYATIDNNSYQKLAAVGEITEQYRNLLDNQISQLQENDKSHLD